MRHIINSHIVFSPNGNTKAIAYYVQSNIDGQLFDITLPPKRATLPHAFERLFVYVPVYSATFPKPLSTLFSKIKTRQLIIIATHGRMTQGRVWGDIAQTIKHQELLGLFSIPQKHTYKDELVTVDLSVLDHFIKHLNAHQLKPLHVLPKEKAYRIARMSEPLRTAFNIRLTINHAQCTQCMQCIKACPVNAIDSDLSISKACIRCVRCVSICGENAIVYDQSMLLKRYLKRVKAPTLQSVYRLR